MNISLFKKLEFQVTRLSADLQQARAKNTTDKDFLEGIKATTTVQKTAPGQLIPNNMKEREKLGAYKAAIDAECCSTRLALIRSLVGYMYP